MSPEKRGRNRGRDRSTRPNNFSSQGHDSFLLANNMEMTMLIIRYLLINREIELLFLKCNTMVMLQISHPPFPFGYIVKSMKNLTKLPRNVGTGMTMLRQ